MHPLFYKLNKNKIIFTNHCKQRLIQRYRLFLLSFEIENPLLFLTKDFENSNINMADFMSPGYMNMIESKYGKNSFYAKSKKFTYACTYNELEKSIIVKTIYLTK